MDRIPGELRDAIRNDSLVVFAGAGLSCELTNIRNKKLKGWSNLIECILNELCEKDYDVSFLKPLITRYEPIRILELIESNRDIPKEKIYSFIKDFFDLDNNNNDLELHKKIYKLSKKIITTNYDNAFEIAVPELRKKKAYKGKNYELTTYKDSESPLLFKLHGCFEDIDSMILFPTDYKYLYENQEKDAEHSILVLKNIILNKSVLFIGTGMSDFQINNIFKEIKRIQDQYNQKHFIITKKSIDTSLNFLTPVEINDYSQVSSVIDELIEIKGQYKSNDSYEIIELKKQLEEVSKLLEKANIEIEESKNTSSIDKLLLERESLEHFTKGGEYGLSNKPIEAIEEYKRALELKPDFHEAFKSWGLFLGWLAMTKEGNDAEDFYSQAFDKFKEAIKIKPDYHEAFNSWGVFLGRLAMTKEGNDAEDFYSQAFDKFEEAIKIKPDYHEAFNSWGVFLGKLARTKESNNAEGLYGKAFDKFKEAIKIKPDYYEALFLWGDTLRELAETKRGNDAEDLYRQACDKFKEAIDIKPDFHKALFFWGGTLCKLAETKQGNDGEDLYRQAFDKFKEAIDIKPDSHEALFFWGCTLGSLARTKESNNAEGLYGKAFDKLKEAIKIKPDYHEAFNSWGLFLGRLAMTKEGNDAEDLYWQACDKFKRAIDIKPDYHEAFNSWGNALGILAETKEGNDAEDLYNEAFDKFEKALEYGASPYHLSCIRALKGDREEALELLEVSLSKNEINAKSVENDENWINYRRDEKFLALLNKYKG